MEKNHDSTEHADSRDAHKILVVDDDIRLRTLLQRFLEEQGFAVKSVPDAGQMDRLLARELFSLIVLDFMLPGEDGLAICRRLRQGRQQQVPIIMLTAQAAQTADRISGLEAGADDYLPKPFNPQELLARIKAVLRRQQRELPGAPSQQVVEVVSAFGPWQLDLSTRQLTRDNRACPGVPDHRRIRRAQGTGATPARTADPRQADESGARPGMGGHGALH